MKTVAFSEAITDVSRGNERIPQSAFLPSGDVPIIDQGRSLIAGYTNDKSSLVRAEPPVIVFGDHTRALKFVDFPFAVGADGVKLLKASPDFDPKYVYHYLRSRPVPSLGYSRHFKVLKETRVPQPPLEAQQRIAGILDRADAIRTKRRQVLAHLDSLTQSVFHNMFGTADHGQIPLANVVDFYSGGTPSKGRKEYWEGTLPWFSAKDIKATDLWDSQDHVASVVPHTTSLRLLPTDTVTLVVRGMILAHTIPVATLRVPATINQDLKALIPRVPVEVDFLSAAIRARHGWILSRVSTAAHGTKKLDSAVLRAVPVPDVALRQQRLFGARVSHVTAQRVAIQRALAADTELFASLQSRAFRGEL